MKPLVRLLFVGCTLGPLTASAQTTGARSAPSSATLSGEFQLGDRVQLQVEGDSLFTATFTVGPGPALTLPAIGAIPLAGVRRADVEPYLRQALARYLKDPVVHAKALIRLAIIGEVEHPGFYSVPVDAVLADALMQAGGPTREARVPGVRVEREGQSILQGDSLQRVLAHGLTVDQVGLRDGDRFVVPRQHNGETPWRILGLLVLLPTAIYGVTRAF
ncbi:MAG TPA: polysaccharide biosynthesis/export family protein [Gemmatimonadales bacterium]|jgi:polysaccharide export outer membrane protein|nr:polysaccharide biosynthesis/export family protein [Gemmatimonadales bacterium]